MQATTNKPTQLEIECAIQANKDRITHLNRMALENAANNSWEFKKIEECNANIQALEKMLSGAA
jgi:hypothetical protein